MGNYNVFAVNARRCWLSLVLAGALGACASAPDEPPLSAPQPAYQKSTAAYDDAGFDVDSGPRLREDAPLTYVVQPGDTLWGLANRFLLDPWQWPEIWYVNDDVANPHLIYPGDVLSLAQIDGRWRLTVERLQPKARVLPLDSAIPMIPLDAILDFLNGPRLVTKQELEESGYVLSFSDNRILGKVGDIFYIRGVDESQAQSAVLRPAEEYRDPDNGDLLGYGATPIGRVRLVKGGDPQTVLMEVGYREALPGDRLFAIEPPPFSDNVYPTAPPDAIGGRIIAVFDGVSQIGQYQIVAINRGDNHGLVPGHVLHILQAGEQVKDPYAPGWFGTRRVQLPDEYAGDLLVFKTTPRLSYCLVMSVIRPVHALDKVEKPGVYD